ncbi:TonB-dependent receptor plug domain-containing protein, partial [Acinetobacter baumannii]
HHDLGEFIRTIPENFTGGQNPGVAGGGNQGGSNINVSSSSALNLRGLGPDATLTLLNGHRLAYDSLSQGVDIAQIPLMAIDRVEVLTDGSS